MGSIHGVGSTIVPGQPGIIKLRLATRPVDYNRPSEWRSQIFRTLFSKGLEDYGTATEGCKS
jgi:hypothetical protein